MQRALLGVACSFFVGVVWRSLAPVDAYVVGTILFVAFVLALVGILRSFHASIIVAIMLCGLALGIVRTEFAYRAFEEGRVYANEASVRGDGVVISEPDVREEHTNIVVELQHNSQTSRFIIKVPHTPQFTYGDFVQIEGSAHIPEAFTTDTGRVFSYDGYLMKDGIHYELRRAVVTPLFTQGGNQSIRSLYALKSRWQEAVSRSIPEPSASLLGGIVVGAKRSLGEQWLQAFRDTGLIHIVVLSGYNLTVIAVFIVWLTKPFTRTLRVLFGVAGIIGFALMTGAGPTVVRASIMAVLALLAQFLARPYVLLRALLVAAIGMVLYNPFVLIFDSGFQLSFVATLGLVVASPLIEPHLTLVPSTLGIRTIVAATFATQLAVLPLLLYHIGSASLVAPLVNVLVLPMVPLVMAVGFVAGAIGMISSTVAGPVALVAHTMLVYIFEVVSLFETFPYASIILPPLSVYVVIIVYGLGGMWVYHKYRHRLLPVSEVESIG